MVKKLSNIVTIIYHRFTYDTIPSRSAEVSFYLLLSFFPFLIFLITLISFIPVIHLNNYIVWLSNVMPSNAYSIVSSIIDNAVRGKSTQLLIVSFLITLWSSTSGISAIIRGINKAYDQEETRSYIKVAGISLLFTMEIVILIVFSLILIVYGSNLGIFVFNYFGLGRLLLLWDRLRYVVSIITMLLIFLSLYIITPNHKIKFSHSLPGAILSTFLWIIASLVFSFYANNFVNYNLIYGSIGGIIALISWIYLSSTVILLGAEVNAALYFKQVGKVKVKTKRY
jgi:membrane protein